MIGSDWWMVAAGSVAAVGAALVIVPRWRDIAGSIGAGFDAFGEWLAIRWPAIDGSDALRGELALLREINTDSKKRVRALEAEVAQLRRDLAGTEAAADIIGDAMDDALAENARLEATLNMAATMQAASVVVPIRGRVK